MIARVRERRRIHAPAASLRREEEGVSPVVGMILVLAISVVGIAAILYWGLPTIEEMKANVEYRSLQGQFNDLDATVKELVAGTTEKTAKRWQPSINRGEVFVQEGTEPWVMAADAYSASIDPDFVWGGFSDGDYTFRILNRASVDILNVKVEAYIVTGTSSQTALNVTLGGSALPNQMTSADLPTWAAGTTRTFDVWVRDASPPSHQSLSGKTFHFLIYNGSSLMGEAWYYETGLVKYALHGGVTEKSVVANNGAVIASSGGTGAIVNTPSIPPPTTTNGVDRVFARAILFKGNASAAGEDTFDMLVSLYATATLANYDCLLSARTDCVEAVKVFNLGSHQSSWYSYLRNTNRGYDYDNLQENVGGETVSYLVDRETHMGFTLLQSTVELR